MLICVNFFEVINYYVTILLEIPNCVVVVSCCSCCCLVSYYDKRDLEKAMCKCEYSRSMDHKDTGNIRY